MSVSAKADKYGYVIDRNGIVVYETDESSHD